MRDFSIIKQKILQYLDIKGISKYKFYQETGITNGILSQTNGLSEENTLKFLSKYRDISLDWLFYDEGSMLRSDAPSDSHAFGKPSPQTHNVLPPSWGAGQTRLLTKTKEPKRNIHGIFSFSIDLNI